jgi:hypothetical protein
VAVAIQAAMGENGQALPLAQRSAIWRIFSKRLSGLLIIGLSLCGLA